MPSFREPYALEEVPRLVVQLETSSGRKVVLGDVDSGADRSLFPLGVATDLGIESELMEDTKKGEGAIGQRFATWSSTAAVTGQVMRLAAEEGFVPWGRLFRMNPAFAETDSFLLGRKDFFAAFHIRFLNSPDGPILELEY